MEISSLDLSYVERALADFGKRRIVLWGAGWHLKRFVEQYCGPEKLIPRPFCVCESTRELGGRELFGIPTLAFEEVKKLHPEETAIIMTAGLLDLQSQVIRSELYYFPIYHRRTLELYAYIKKNSDLCDEAIGILTDERSKVVYRKRIENTLAGSFWDQSLFERHPYFGNDLIPEIGTDGAFVFAGAFNGKHLVRALKNTPAARIVAFEPSAVWHARLQETYNDNPNVVIHNNILWSDRRRLPFRDDMANSGLGAQVISGDAERSYTVETTTIDSCVKERVSLIALDVEGSEQQAIAGASGTIDRDRPKLSLCLYHTLDDYFRLPIQVHEMGKGQYRLYVKHHSCISEIETVLYAI